jgi:hypothetical protein
MSPGVRVELAKHDPKALSFTDAWHEFRDEKLLIDLLKAHDPVTLDRHDKIVLQENKGDIFLEDSVLHVAILNGLRDLFDAVLAIEDLDVGITNGFVPSRDLARWAPALNTAMSRGDKYMVTQLLKRGADPWGFDSYEQIFALGAAVVFAPDTNETREIINILAPFYKSPTALVQINDPISYNGPCALEEACLAKNKNAIRALVENGADCNIPRRPGAWVPSVDPKQ